MNEHQYQKQCNTEKRYPGCMGRMVNLLDLSSGLNVNRMLTDKAQFNGSALPRSHHDVPMKTPPRHNAYTGEYVAQKPIDHELRRSFSEKKGNGTPMKMLIAQEMSKEFDTKQKPPSVVARLMGLETLPAQQPISTWQRSSPEVSPWNPTVGRQDRHHLPVHSNMYSHSGTTNTYMHSGAIQRNQQQEVGLEVEHLPHKRCSPETYFRGQEGYKDVYEVWQKTEKLDAVNLQKDRYEKSLDEKMALVRQKFMDAKRLATDEKLRQSKEFQDALEVLSSNKDLFLKFLQEPNSLFSKHILDLQSIPPPPQSRRITVLRPSKSMAASNGLTKLYNGSDRYVDQEVKREKQVKKQDPTGYMLGNSYHCEMDGMGKEFKREKVVKKPDPTNCFLGNSQEVSEKNHDWDFSKVRLGAPSQPTRIVVLKPSPGKTQDIRALISSPNQNERFSGLGPDGTKGSREIAREITRQMTENLTSDTSRRDESFSSPIISSTVGRDDVFMSSMVSNGYVGDESSFNRSETEFAEGGSISDSEVSTPTSRNSWDYINKFSRSSSSSISRASCSPESSVSREAKKRLSARWAMMANGAQDQRQLRRSSSTLGEMLALPELKKPERSSEERSNGVLSQSSNLSPKGEIQEGLSSFSEGRTINEINDSAQVSPRSLARSRSVPVSSTSYEAMDLVGGKSNTKDSGKPKGGGFFMGKVSNFFFSRSKKGRREKHNSVGLGPWECGGSLIIDLERENTHPAEVEGDASQSMPLAVGEECPNTPISTACDECSSQAVSSPPKQQVARLENLNENGDQPSPISVLESPFEDEASPLQEKERVALDIKPRMPFNLPKSDGTTRPLEQPRTASLSLPTLDASRWLPSPLTPHFYFWGESEQEVFLFVETILNASGLLDEPECSIFGRWYSPNSPLDPVLLDKCLDKNGSVSSKGGERECCSKQNDPVTCIEGERKSCSDQNGMVICKVERRDEMERKLVFDCINAVLVEITGPCLDAHPWARPRRQGPVGQQLVQATWNLLREWAHGEGLERDLSGWFDLGQEMDWIGTEIERCVLEDLIEDALCELSLSLSSTTK
ncbi:uncharacterized protein LOC18444081 [Amborella trichopoda]|uniref:DUF4378 domain-containing protein n=1 Tax=Amborella trichopoda TaxID=13333 RepID=U5D606_AMBTC|nr:uncharacterized protein LOC18444081 [Amborella trichopoda]XP_020529160.1 uncharacterized protein LOC18444081 [Amborella trichopoda]XP_020529161.1 uncharacterized protein LOC18444081 [Amborella trichopoda]ERN15788.1 hypothetical protein AMTR_s00039p00119340 [Amborella trichopoda]|eukprot:XP_006854321.1 uncharacterized protein LOC18444081 [Amborella trichopoda]